MKQKEIIYYKDELNEEFSTAKIVPRKIDENYKYIHKSVIWNAIAFLLQNVLSVPIKFLYAKIKFKIKNKIKKKSIIILPKLPRKPINKGKCIFLYFSETKKEKRDIPL